MRTDDEILQRIEQVGPTDFLGFQATDLISYLPFEKARKYLKPDTTAEDWGDPRPRDRASIIATMLDYMPFAWAKANDCRGISAARSMDHYTAWIWMAGDDLGDLRDYEFYGKDNLVRICEFYGWDASKWDDGVRHN